MKLLALRPSVLRSPPAAAPEWPRVCGRSAGAEARLRGPWPRAVPIPAGTPQRAALRASCGPARDRGWAPSAHGPLGLPLQPGMTESRAGASRGGPASARPQAAGRAEPGRARRAGARAGGGAGTCSARSIGSPVGRPPPASLFHSSPSAPFSEHRQGPALEAPTCSRCPCPKWTGQRGSAACCSDPVSSSALLAWAPWGPAVAAGPWCRTSGSQSERETQ